MSSKKKIVILGAGWGGYLFAKQINVSKFDVCIISPRNHFIFTPLLPSAAVGTLEYRCIQESVRNIKGINYYQAKARELDIQKQQLTCQSTYENNKFQIGYDYIVFATGSHTNTFGIPGVEYNKNNVYFMKDLEHARAVRNRIVECFERASYPDSTVEQKKQLLSFVIVGGGPISVEFGGELYDFITNDLNKWYPDLRQYIQVHLIEAGKSVLAPYNPELQQYAQNLLIKRKFNLRVGVAVKEVRDGEVVLGNGEIIKCGMVVWSTGVAPTKFIKNLAALNNDFIIKNGRLLMDDKLRILKSNETFQAHKNIFGIGDCAMTYSEPLPTLGYVAKKQGQYLAKNFNNGTIDDPKKKFRFMSLLQMTHIGGGDAIIDTQQGSITGWKGKFIWKISYWGLQVSLVNKILIPMFWFKSWLFGRDISKF